MPCTVPPPDASGPLASCGWLAGSWATQNGARRTEETWLEPAGGVMLGLSRTVAGGRCVEFEFLRIAATSGGIEYVAIPSGQQETHFALIESDTDRLVFANPDHDFPQRIIYQRSEQGMTAGIEGEQNGKTRAATWHYTRTR